MTTFVIDTDAVGVLANRMDRAAIDGEDSGADVSRALELAELTSNTPARLTALADDYRFVAGVLRLTIERVEGAALTAAELAAFTGQDETTIQARLTLLENQGITDPDEVLAAFITLGAPEPDPTSVRDIVIGLPPPGEDPAVDAAVARLDANVLPRILAGEPITIGSAQERADLELVAGQIFPGGVVPVPTAFDADGIPTDSTDVAVGDLSDDQLGDAVAVGLGINRFAAQVETDALALDDWNQGGTGSTASTASTASSGDSAAGSDAEPSTLSDDDLVRSFNDGKQAIDDAQAQARVNRGTAQTINSAAGKVGETIGSLFGRKNQGGFIGDVLGFGLSEFFNARAAAADASVDPLKDRVADLGLEIAKREGINVIDGKANRVDGDGNFVNGNDNSIDGNRNAVIGDDNRTFGDRNRVFGNDNFIDGDGNRIDGNGNQTVGGGNNVDGDNNRTFGGGNNVDGDGNRTDGDGNSVRGDGNRIDGDGNVIGDDDEGGGSNNNVNGNDNNVNGDDNRVNGNDNSIDGDGSGADGDGSRVRGDNSFAFGGGRQVDGDNTISTPFGDVDKDTGRFTPNSPRPDPDPDPSPDPDPDREGSGGGDSGRGRDQDTDNGRNSAGDAGGGDPDGGFSSPF